MLKGGCFCGRIRYEALGTPFHETNYSLFYLSSNYRRSVGHVVQRGSVAVPNRLW